MLEKRWIIREEDGREFEPTPILRWTTRTLNIEKEEKVVNILTQMVIDCKTGEKVWRDVPFRTWFEEEKKDEKKDGPKKS